MNQLDLHKKIDEFVNRNPVETKPEELNALLSQAETERAKQDAKDYFFYRADEKWLDWLWENGFLDAIKQKSEDPTRYSYKTPELNYLVKVAEKTPDKVVDIMLQVPISKETFNPEVVDRFVYICSKLPVDQLIRIIRKIKDEKWIPLMDVFNQWGFEYEEMLKKLHEARDYENLLILAETILSVRSKEEIQKQDNFSKNPFYFGNLSYTKVFWYLKNVSDEYLEKSLELLIKILNEVINNISEKDKESVFKLKDNFYFLENFFELKVKEDKDLWGKDNVKELIACILEISRKLIYEKHKENKEKIREVFKDILDFDKDEKLADTYTTWKLRLAILGLDGLAFKEEIKKALFRIFKVGDRYYEVLTVEYKKLLQICFGCLDEKDKREYVNKIIDFFVKQKKKYPKKEWIIKDGSEILSLIFDHLTEDQKTKAKENGFYLDRNIEIKPEVEIKFGTFVSRAPISYEEFSKMKIEEILEKLTNEWTPENLYETYKNKYDFFEPINAEGIGKLIKEDVSKRLESYLEFATKFFDREKIHPHYTHSFLIGVQIAIRDNKVKTKDINWDNLIKLLLEIKKSGEERVFEDKDEDLKLDYGWLGNWNSVHFAMADVIRELLKSENGKSVVDFKKYRKDLLETIKYLLSYPDPIPEDEKIDTTKKIVESEGDKKVIDPFTMAINSVRGRAFEDFVLFIYQDGEKLKEDVKKTYKDVLEKENTRPLMFMFGYYLPSFYFRDKKWTKNLFFKIFPKENNYLYTASWQGYLSQNLYKELFFEPKIQELYEYGITLKEDEKVKQEYFKNLDEGIAVHLALAFVHFKEFDFGNKLFEKFWAKGNPTQHFHFVSFIGRYLIKSEENRIEKIEKEGVNVKEKIKKFWNWMLENYRKSTKPFEGFGFWIDLEKNIFEAKEISNLIKKTLEKTDGILEWDYALTKSIVKLAQESPEDALEISRLFLLNGIVNHNRINSILPYIDKEWFETFNTLFQNSKTKEKVIPLINELIKQGDGPFWILKKAVF